MFEAGLPTPPSILGLMADGPAQSDQDPKNREPTILHFQMVNKSEIPAVWPRDAETYE